MPEKCKICGCDEEHACITPEGPCSWSFRDRRGSVCTACVVELPPDPRRPAYPKENLLVEKLCVHCANCVRPAGNLWTCSKGHFDTPGDTHRWYVYNSVRYPNKAVAKARRACTEWTIHPRYTMGGKGDHEVSL